MVNAAVDPLALSSIDGLRSADFDGFETVKQLRAGSRAAIPGSPGVYLFVRDDPSPPEFLAAGTGRHFKRKDPNVPIARLRDEWVDGALVVYIGQSGSGNDGTLKKRIAQMLRFGQGAPVGYWGSRLVWQLHDAERLQVCWRALHGDDPLHVIIEIKGCRGEDARVKRATMETYRVPEVNTLGSFGRWALAEFTNIYEIEAGFDKLVRGFLLEDAAE